MFTKESRQARRAAREAKWEAMTAQALMFTMMQ